MVSSSTSAAATARTTSRCERGGSSKPIQERWRTYSAALPATNVGHGHPQLSIDIHNAPANTTPTGSSERWVKNLVPTTAIRIQATCIAQSMLDTPSRCQSGTARTRLESARRDIPDNTAHQAPRLRLDISALTNKSTVPKKIGATTHRSC